MIDAARLYDALRPLAEETGDGVLLARAVVILELAGDGTNRRLVLVSCDASGLSLYPWDELGLVEYSAREGFPDDVGGDDGD